MKFFEETNKEFQEFMKEPSEAPPKTLTEKIFSNVHQNLNPSSISVFSKLSLVHFIVGALTLSLCPQFGIRLFGEGLGIMKFFLPLGAYGCIAVCGAFFVGTSLFASGFFLRPEDIKVLKKHRWLQVSALSFLSLGAFIMAEAQILFWFAFVWAIGSIIGGVAMLEVGRLLKPNFR